MAQKQDAITAAKERAAEVKKRHQQELETLNAKLEGYANEQSEAEKAMDTAMAGADQESYIAAKKKAGEAADNIEWVNRRREILKSGSLISEEEFAGIMQSITAVQEAESSLALEKAMKLIREADQILHAAKDVCREGDLVLSSIALDIMHDEERSRRIQYGEISTISSLLNRTGLICQNF